jgi:hypothetical protein
MARNHTSDKDYPGSDKTSLDHHLNSHGPERRSQPEPKHHGNGHHNPPDRTVPGPGTPGLPGTDRTRGGRR